MARLHTSVVKLPGSLLMQQVRDIAERITAVVSMEKEKRVVPELHRLCALPMLDNSTD